MPIQTTKQSNSILSWLHFGDLHLTNADEQNNQDFRTLIWHANANLSGAVDFALLPGDNVEDGTETQFALVAGAIDRLTIPSEMLRGDHDAARASSSPSIGFPVGRCLGRGRALIR
jgi:3',5'-cyclic-AMP phosphodiesterase